MKIMPCWVVTFSGLLLTVISLSSCAVLREKKIVELSKELDSGTIPMPDFEETFEIKPLIEMKYRLIHNTGKDFDLGSWIFEIPGDFAELQSSNTAVSIGGIFDADIKIFGKHQNGSSYTVAVTVTGIYALNLTEVYMNHTLERPRDGLLFLKPHECLISSSKSAVSITKTLQNLPRSFLDELSDWMSRALKEDLQRFLCDTLTFELNRGMESLLVRDLLKNIDCAEKQSRRLTLGRYDTPEGC